MLSWVVKVVPQPPEPPAKVPEEKKEGKPAAAPPPAAAAPPPAATAPPPVQEKKVTFQDEHKNEAPKADKPKQEAETATGNGPVPGSQSGVLTWISTALPQPAVSPKLNRANSTTKEEAATASQPEDEKGVMAWISQGLEKVVPQPDLKSKESPAAEPPAEVRPKAAAAPAAEPQITVMEVKSDREDKSSPPSMMDWIKQGIEKVVPHPESHVRAKTDGNEKTEVAASTKGSAEPPPAAPAAPPAPPAPPAPAAPAAAVKPAVKPATDKSTKEAEQQPNMMGWIVSEIGRMLPQPVQKPDAGSDEVQTRGRGGQSPLK